MKIRENNKEYNVVIKENGDKHYYHNNKLHRENGAAIELSNGSKIWYFNGKIINCSSQKEFDRLTNNLKQKKYFDVKIETLLPATLHYKILATSAEEAVEIVKKSNPNNVKYKLIGKKDIKLMVFESGSALIKFIKKYL